MYSLSNFPLPFPSTYREVPEYRCLCWAIPRHLIWPSVTGPHRRGHHFFIVPSAVNTQSSPLFLSPQPRRHRMKVEGLYFSLGFPASLCSTCFLLSVLSPFLHKWIIFQTTAGEKSTVVQFFLPLILSLHRVVAAARGLGFLTLAPLAFETGYSIVAGAVLLAVGCFTASLVSALQMSIAFLVVKIENYLQILPSGPGAFALGGKLLL